MDKRKNASDNMQLGMINLELIMFNQKNVRNNIYIYIYIYIYIQRERERERERGDEWITSTS